MHCKQGDLAIVISNFNTPELVGMIVRVKRPEVRGEIFHSIDGKPTRAANGEPFAWVCAAEHPLPWRYMGQPKLYDERPILDCALRPVSGLPMEEETTNDIKEPA